MPEDRLSQLRKGYAEEDCLGLEAPDLGPLQALAESAEFAEAVARLADAYGRPLPADDPLAPLACDIARGPHPHRGDAGPPGRHVPPPVERLLPGGRGMPGR